MAKQHYIINGNLYADSEAAVITRHGTTEWFKTGKGVHQDYISSHGLLNLYAQWKVKVKITQSCPSFCNIMWNARLDKSQAGIKISGIKTGQ